MNRQLVRSFGLALSLALCSGLQAQDQPFYGLKLPGPATLQTIDFNSVDFAPIAAVDMDGKPPSISPGRLHAYLSDYVGIALKSRERNPQRWGIFSGFPEEEVAYNYIRGHLERLGVEGIEVKTFDQKPYSLSTSWKVEVTDPRGKSVELQSAVLMGVGSRESFEPRTAPLIYVGRGRDVDLVGRDVRGKIAVIRGESAPHFFDSWTSSAMPRLSTAGAVGVLRLWDTPGNMQLNLGSCGRNPAFNLGGEDSVFLEALMVQAEKAGELDKVQVRLETQIERKVRTAKNLVGRIRGTGNGTENIMLVAHADSYFGGAGDNAAGLAVLLGLVEHYAKNRPSHDIYIVVSPGHHHGNGGSEFFVQNYPEIVKNNMLTINLEHVASTGVTRSYADSMRQIKDAYGNTAPDFEPTTWDGQWRIVTMSRATPFLVKAWRDAAEKTFYVGTARVFVPTRSVPGEASAIGAAGANVVQNVEVDHWYHSSGATAETVSPQALGRAFMFFSRFVDTVDRASRAQIEAQ